MGIKPFTMETMTIPVVAPPILSDREHGLELRPVTPVVEVSPKEGRIVLAAGVVLAAYSLIYLFVLAVKFPG